jgi:hypothetical protein
MSLHPQGIPAVPEETMRVARAAFAEATSICACMTHSGPSTPISSSSLAFHPVGSRPRPLALGVNDGDAVCRGLVRWSGLRGRPQPPPSEAAPVSAIKYIPQVTAIPTTPHLITNVETTPATTPDDNMAAVIHASLAPATSPPGASGRQRLHRCCHARRESARVRRDHRRAGGRRSQVASPSRGGSTGRSFWSIGTATSSPTP